LAEDIAQEAFVAFHRHHPAGIAGASAWLHLAATRGALNAIRSARRREGRERGHVRGLGERAPFVADDPLESALRTETQREVRAALARLRRKYAAVLALRYAGLSYAEVAAALHVRTNQVGTLLVRAEAALKKELNDVAPH
jgi:RNA polymerase sigma-70 factor (ECF subfamily)